MGNISFGCQTYSWQMSYDKFAGNMPHIMNTVKKAGFDGIEAEVCMMGKYFEDWSLYKNLLNEYELKYAALALPLNWLNPTETDEEYAMAEKAMNFLKHFPGTVLLLCHLPGQNRENLRERQDNQIACISAIAKRAAAEGIVTAFHPNSSFGSAFRTIDDYKYLLDKIDGTDLGYCPDAGHIAHGDMDPVAIIKEYAPLIRHVHYKDMNTDGIWESMGKGSIDFPTITEILKNSNYNGWIMVEEESQAAVIDPDTVTIQNGRYFKNSLLDIVK